MAKRTTVSADDDDYLTLEREAERRGVPIGHVLREAVMEYAAGVRETNLPTFGYASGAPGLSEESATDEDAPILDQAPQDERQSRGRD